VIPPSQAGTRGAQESWGISGRVAVQQLRQDELALGGRGKNVLPAAQHWQARSPGGPMVTPQVPGQLAMDRQLAQLTPALLHAAEGRAVATAAAAGTMAHPDPWGWLKLGR